LRFMHSLLSNPGLSIQFSIHELVEKTGRQGGELLMWLAMRAALTTGAASGIHKVHSNYHIPISNTATGLLALEKVG
jgi:protocatechuate 4,5-dioxygenase beta chain